MYASTQYLLCGLPLITTKSRGGRDGMFNELDCIYVPDTPGAVAAAVKEAISRQLKPEDVRRRVLEKMREHRKKLIGIVQDYLQRRGSDKIFAEIFSRHFTNKLLAVKPMEELKMFSARKEKISV